MSSFDVRDFDEVGVPEDVDVKWRLETTDHWLKIAKENLTNGISTIICGSTVPEEIFASSEYNSTLAIRFGLLEITDSSIQERLSERSWDQESIDAYKSWQKTLIDAVKKTKNYQIFDGNKSLTDIINNLKMWINGMR
ncbi:MAG: hypothetical protein ACTSO7_13070 [Candidatus Heimdallarchaeota archaeon]